MPQPSACPPDTPKKEKEKRIERKREAKEEALRRNVAEVGSREVSSAAATLDAEWPVLR